MEALSYHEHFSGLGPGRFWLGHMHLGIVFPERRHPIVQSFALKGFDRHRAIALQPSLAGFKGHVR